MATGFCPYLLKSMNEVAGADNPEFKITVTGFLKTLLKSNAVRGARVLDLNLGNGQKRQVFIKYQPRYPQSAVVEVDNCDIDVIPAYSEMELLAPRVAKTGIYISIEDLRKYCEDAVQTVQIGQPSTSFMREFLSSVMRAANALIGTIDRRLLTDTVWGINQVTGVNTTTTVNINVAPGTNNVLTEGVTKILADAFANEMCGDLQIVGSGLFNNYNIQQIAACCAGNGVDTSKFTSYNWNPDLYASAIWGANQIGIFSQGAIGFVDLNKFIGAFAIQLGTSTLFQATIPTNTACNDGTAEMLTFDMQLKPIECPTELLNHYGEVTSYDKGWALFISKNYGLFQLPGTMYDASDRLTGNNGSLRYTITNS